MKSRRHAIVEGTLPSLHILRNLWHLNVGIEFFNFIHDGIFVIVFKVIDGLLQKSWLIPPIQKGERRHTLGFCTVPTMAFSWPRVMESAGDAWLRLELLSCSILFILVATFLRVEAKWRQLETERFAWQMG